MLFTLCNRNTVEFAVSGQYALFSDILTRAGGEKTSYHVPTYEALKGVLQSVFWKPTIIWIVDDVRVMNPIRFARKGIRPIKYNGGNELAYYTYLADVRYQVRAHFEWNMNRPELAHDRNENKYHNMAKRICFITLTSSTIQMIVGFQKTLCRTPLSASYVGIW